MARTDYEAEHQEAFTEAARIYKQRSQVRGQMWLEWPPSDKIRELRERVMRIEACYCNRERLMDASGQSVTPETLDATIIEDALDLINYANFLIKQVKRGMSG